MRGFSHRARGLPGWVIALLVLVLPAVSLAALPVRPSRVLVVADARARDGHVFREAGELGDALALLSLWGIPHDVLRVDTQLLREENLIDPAGQPVYGVILWAVRSDLLPRRFHEGDVLREACLKHHISLIGFGGRIDVPAVQEILGLRVLGWREGVAGLRAGEPHFITRDEAALPACSEEPWCTSGPVVEAASPETRVLLRGDDQPLLTARTLDGASGTRAVWLGGDAERLLRGDGSGLGIHLFQRALAWSLGAVVIHEYDNMMLLRMDDPGAAQASYLHGWDYPSLSEALIRQKIFAPLREHHGRLDVFCCPGYVDTQSRSIVHAEQVERVDIFGNLQNIRSMFTVLLEGQKQGLIEIASHGWTHMAPDLDTAIAGGTNWWAGSASAEWPDYRWYREFYDLRRDREVPAEVQLLHLRTSCEWLEGYFGRRPLAFCPPGHAVSGDSWVYAKEMVGTLEVRLEGAEPKAAYRLLVGEDEDEWTVLGELRADAAGTISATLSVPAHLWLDARGHFTINRVPGHTQFVAGPIREALGFDFSLALRDKGRMSPGERKEFAEASQSLRRGRITGHLDTRTYRLPVREACCTYQAAGRAGMGLVIDTACHSLSGEQVTTLRMVPVLGCPEDVGPAASSRAGMPAVFRFHDFDMIEEPDFLIEAYKVMAERGRPPSCLSADELVGYLHSRWTVRGGPDNSLVATADFSAAACRYLRDHESNWTLLATDEVVAALRSSSGRLAVHGEGPVDLALGGAPGPMGSIPLHVPGGKEVHTLVVHAELP